MDGIDNTSRNGSRQIRLVITTPENVEEMQLMTGAYSAEFGRAAGGVINVITRSGTNAFRGSVLAMSRPSTLIALFNGGDMVLRRPTRTVEEVDEVSREWQRSIRDRAIVGWPEPTRRHLADRRRVSRGGRRDEDA